MTSEPDALRIGIGRTGSLPPRAGKVRLLLRAQERRGLVFEGATVVSDRDEAGGRRVEVAA